MSRVKRYFIAGLVAIVPFLLTIYVLLILFRFTDNILGRFLNVLFKRFFGFYVYGLGVILFIFIVFFVGFLADRYIGKKILYLIEKWILNLPLIKNIYPGFKQIISFIFEQKEINFKKVVLVEYPSRGIWSFGFLTNEECNRLSQILQKEVVSVFIPSSPNPLTGFVIFIPKENLKFLDISIAEALRIIFSGGVFK